MLKSFKANRDRIEVAAPEWAEWVCFDENLKVWFFESKPVLNPPDADDDTIWFLGPGSCGTRKDGILEAGIVPYCAYWRKSLRRLRPVVHSEYDQKLQMEWESEVEAERGRNI